MKLLEGLYSGFLSWNSQCASKNEMKYLKVTELSDNLKPLSVKNIEKLYDTLKWIGELNPEISSESDYEEYFQMIIDEAKKTLEEIEIGEIE